MAFKTGHVGSAGRDPRAEAGRAPAALPCLAAAPFNLGATVVLLVLFRVLTSRGSVRLSLLFHRNWYQQLVESGSAGSPVFAQHLSRRAGHWTGSVVSFLVCRHPPWAPRTLAQEFSQALCICAIRKNNKSNVVVCPLSKEKLRGLFSSEEEREDLGSLEHGQT